MIVSNVTLMKHQQPSKTYPEVNHSIPAHDLIPLKRFALGESGIDALRALNTQSDEINRLWKFQIDDKERYSLKLSKGGVFDFLRQMEQQQNKEPEIILSKL